MAPQEAIAAALATLQEVSQDLLATGPAADTGAPEIPLLLAPRQASGLSPAAAEFSPLPPPLILATTRHPNRNPMPAVPLVSTPSSGDVTTKALDD